ncbi:MAG: YdcF family protein [Scytonema sp. CRU_2_7]|nr:YdcF family protein [Scytonema sp. CRU_2_7]
MIAHVVVPEGLAIATDKESGQCLLSDYYEAVLTQVIHSVPLNGQVFLAPGNRFDYPASEEQYAAEYLMSKRPDLNIFVPSDISHPTYLDTFDNAIILRTWLQKQGRWPLEKVNLYCNAPHYLRSAVLFRLCGFQVQSVIGCRPKSVHRKMVPRLWFYDYPIIQSLYEFTALVYDFGRWLVWKISTKNCY